MPGLASSSRYETSDSSTTVVLCDGREQPRLPYESSRPQELHSGASPSGVSKRLAGRKTGGRICSAWTSAWACSVALIGDPVKIMKRVFIKIKERKNGAFLGTPLSFHVATMLPLYLQTHTRKACKTEPERSGSPGRSADEIATTGGRGHPPGTCARTRTSASASDGLATTQGR
ncbi:hypothetical protein SEVIR_9G560666v4 [Setaria viridis]